MSIAAGLPILPWAQIQHWAPIERDGAQGLRATGSCHAMQEIDLVGVSRIVGKTGDGENIPTAGGSAQGWGELDIQA